MYLRLEKEASICRIWITFRKRCMLVIRIYPCADEHIVWCLTATPGTCCDHNHAQPSEESWSCRENISIFYEEYHAPSLDEHWH